MPGRFGERVELGLSLRYVLGRARGNFGWVGDGLT